MVVVVEGTLSATLLQQNKQYTAVTGWHKNRLAQKGVREAVLRYFSQHIFCIYTYTHSGLPSLWRLAMAH